MLVNENLGQLKNSIKCQDLKSDNKSTCITQLVIIGGKLLYSTEKYVKKWAFNGQLLGITLNTIWCWFEKDSFKNQLKSRVS